MKLCENPPISLKQLANHSDTNQVAKKRLDLQEQVTYVFLSRKFARAF